MQFIPNCAKKSTSYFATAVVVIKASGRVRLCGVRGGDDARISRDWRLEISVKMQKWMKRTNIDACIYTCGTVTISSFIHQHADDLDVDLTGWHLLKAKKGKPVLALYVKIRNTFIDPRGKFLPYWLLQVLIVTLLGTHTAGNTISK